MAETHGSHTRIYANGRDISSAFKEAEFGRGRELVDTTAFGDSADTKLASPIVGGDLNAAGMLQTSSGGVNTIQDMLNAANALLTGESVVVGMLRDTTAGDRGFALLGSITNNRVKAPLSDVVATSFDAKAKRALWVKSIHPLAARTAAHTTTGIDNGAATDYGGAGVLQVTALSGTNPVLACKLQDSADSTNGVDGTWADLVTFDAINAAGVAAGYADVQVATGTVDDWIRLVLTVSSGSLTSVTFAAQFGRYTANY